jgi:ATP phosphoribosyltransferase regulatory subunit
LVKGAGIPAESEAALFQALQAKDHYAVRNVCARLDNIDVQVRQGLLLLPDLYGDEKMLALAKKALPHYPAIIRALDELELVGSQLKTTVDTLAFDLSDLRGYHYHSGLVFAAYTCKCPNAIALGGRYDEVGKAFGRARPATGFSMDLRELSGLVQRDFYPKGILAPCSAGNSQLERKIEQLRNEGNVVIIELPGHEQTQEMFNCDRRLVLQDGKWVITDV